MFSKKIVFEAGSAAEYNETDGYGLVDVSGIQDGSRTDSEAALMCGGWNVRRLMDGAGAEPVMEDRQEKLASGKDVEGESRCRNVVVYRIDVPEFGTYCVYVRIAGAASKLILFAGRRNLIDYGINVEAGAEYARTFYQAVTPYIPALCSERCNDKCIFISVAGGPNCGLQISVEVTREDVPIIWVAGDSTLTDQNAGIQYYPHGSCAGWAQMLARYIDGAAVCNLAHSGMTTNCFRDDGHYDIVKEFMKPGDLFIMQFGHNDQKRRNLAAFGGYAENLRRYVREVRELGAEPIICSPISRIPDSLTDADAAELKEKNVKGYLDNEKTDSQSGKVYYSILDDHARACRQVAEELGVTFVDLHRKTFDKWTGDIQAAHDYFMPGDITHTNEYGAVFISNYFIEEIRKAALGEVSGALCLAAFDNHREYAALLPDMDTKVLPKEFPGPDIFRIEPPYVDIKGIPEYEGIKKAFRLGLLDPCVMHLHPYAPMPRAQLMMLLFRAFGKAGARPYKGHFEDISFDEWDSGYIQALINMGIADTNEIRFRPDDPLTYWEFREFIDAFARQGLGMRGQLEGVLENGMHEHNSGNLCGSESEIREAYGIAKNDEATRAEVYSVLADIMEMRGGEAKVLPSDTEVHPVH
ncbi:MAG: S-layer homology domain-containing protein [Butyrivibrio sp.]|nr:S-layer homology domain-containing protein [Butyrivibrio sp.]